MTIKDYAAEQGITPQSVYQRLKKNKIRIESLTEKGTGEITAEGMAVLSKLYDPEKRQTKPHKDELIEGLNERVAELAQENSTLIEKVKGLEEMLRFYKEQLAEVNKALEKSQLLQQQTLSALPIAGKAAAEAPADPIKLTWKERLTGRRSSR